jgi:uridine kinase
LIAVDGPSGAGKSSFARKLSKILTNSSMVEFDNFITWTSLDIGLERAINQLFEPLLINGKARYQARDWEGNYFGDGLGVWHEVPECDFVIIEGVSTGRLELSKYFDLTIWVEAPDDICLQRGLDRDGAHLIEHWRAFKEMEDGLFLKDKIRIRADYVINTVTNALYKT